MRTPCLFVSDLHGRLDRYGKLLAAIAEERPGAVFLGGDLLPSGGPERNGAGRDFLLDWLGPRLSELRARLGGAFPPVLAIFGNDDPRTEEGSLERLERQGLVLHAHRRRLVVAGVPVYGYACVPPTPFLLKDWERYDVSRFVDPGSVSPEEGRRSVAVPEGEAKWGTIAGDLEALVGGDDVSGGVFLFHAPPYRTALDRAALDGGAVDHAPLDVHVGSIAIRRFIEGRQPLATLHGHVHESARLTGAWRDRIGRTICLSAAHDGPELALVRFDLEAPAAASRELR
jgi:Icc-related predicted phosphoesterase